MSSLNAQSLITGQMKNTISSVTGKLPNGQIPFKEGIADLKGILTNPITLQNTLKSGTNVPPNFLKDFDPTQDLVSNISIPTINLP